MRKYLTQTPLKTDADVQLFVAAFNEPKIGTKVICRNPEHTPVFRIFSNIILEKVRNSVVWGSRSGSKTYLYGGLDTWYKSASRPQYETKILGGSEGQSILSYDAIKQFQYLSDPDNVLVKRLLRTKADFYNRAQVSILTASSKSVRGPHPQCLKLDEVDEIDERVFEDALSQPISKHGYSSSLIMFSTNHNVGGQMDRAIERAKEKGYPVYKYCFDKETEVLTRRGWKKFKEVWHNDYILSLNPCTEIPEWVTVKDSIQYHYNGNLIHFKNQLTDIMVTPNHRMYAKRGQKGYWELVPAEELIQHGDFFFCRHANWKGEYREFIDVIGHKIPMPFFCEFMGWFLSEGCAKANKYTIFIGQDRLLHPQKYNDILECVKRMCQFIGHTGKIGQYPNGVGFQNEKLHTYLHKYGKSLKKYVPDEIKNADKESISIFLNTYRKGDGGITGRGQIVYYTASHKMQSDLGELIIKNGKFPTYIIREGHYSNNPMYMILETSSKTTRFRKNTGHARYEYVPYDDDVYCVNLSRNHIMLTRRNGKCSWQGNCVWETLESCRDYECSTCKLSHICPGKQMKEADGYYKIEDFIDKLNTLSFSALSRDWLCIKVGLGDTVYEHEWDEKIHVCSVDLRMDKPVTLSVDFGGIDPFTCGVWQESPGGKEFGPNSWVRVTELYMTSEQESTTNQNFIAKAKAAPWAKLVKEIIPDNSRPDLIQEWRAAFPKAKFTIIDKGTIDEGIEAVKNALRPVLGAPKIYVNRICLHFRREIQMYKIKNGKTLDKDNHTLDETRYFVLAKIRRVEKFSIASLNRNLYPE